MKEIAARFCIMEPEDIRHLLLTGEKVELTHRMRQYAASGRVEFSQEPDTGDNGTSWSQSFRAVVREPEIMEYQRRKAYIGVFRTDGSIFVIGSATETPVITVTPYENAFVVECSFDTAEPAII